MEIYDNFLTCDIVIETTRRCNLSCEHCLRGEKENIDFNTKFLDIFLSKLKKIKGYEFQLSNVVFSGGEPFLVPNIIRELIEIIKKYNDNELSYYIATNGTIINEDVKNFVIDYLMECVNSYSDSELRCIEISNDIYHEPLTEEQENFWKIFKMVGFRNSRTTSVLNEGRARNIVDKEKVEVSDYEVCISDYDIDIVFYLNCNGEILLNCDLSYDRQRNMPYPFKNTVENLDINEWLDDIKEKIEEEEENEN